MGTESRLNGVKFRLDDLVGSWATASHDDSGHGEQPARQAHAFPHGASPFQISEQPLAMHVDSRALQRGVAEEQPLPAVEASGSFQVESEPEGVVGHAQATQHPCDATPVETADFIDALSVEAPHLIDGEIGVNLTRSLYCPGLLHIINNCLKDVGQAMQDFAPFEEQLKHVSNILARPWLRRRLIATCFHEEPLKSRVHELKGETLHLYSGRWESLVQVVSQMLRVGPLLQHAWSADKFGRGTTVVPAEAPSLVAVAPRPVASPCWESPPLG